MDRPRPTRRSIAPSFFVVFLLSMLPALETSLHAENFRIETRIHQDPDEQPISETVTLFQDGVVYDFLASPRQIAVFRRPMANKPGRFILLDPQLQVQTELTTDRIERFLDKLGKFAAMQRDPMLRFAAAPEFDESFERNTGKLVLASHVQNYEVKTAPAPKPAALAEYREFLDWYARLNALMHGGPPPNPRLAVNAALARHEVVPVSVELTNSGQKDPLRATHEFTWRLSRQDRARIEEVRDALTDYKHATNEEFLTRATP